MLKLKNCSHEISLEAPNRVREEKLNFFFPAK